LPGEPVAHFEITNGKSVEVELDTPRVGKYVVLKLIDSSFDTKNIDSEYFALVGYEGKREVSKIGPVCGALGLTKDILSKYAFDIVMCKALKDNTPEEYVRSLLKCILELDRSHLYLPGWGSLIPLAFLALYHVKTVSVPIVFEIWEDLDGEQLPCIYPLLLMTVFGEELKMKIAPTAQLLTSKQIEVLEAIVDTPQVWQHVDSSIFLVLKILALPETKVGLAEFIKKAKENSAPQTT